MFVALVQSGDDANTAPNRYAENNQDVDRIPTSDTFIRLRQRLLQSGSLLPVHSNRGRRPARLTEELQTAVLDNSMLIPISLLGNVLEVWK